MWIIWLFWMGSHYIHSSANQWSAVTGSFNWGAHHLTVLNGLSLQTFISQSVICCKWQFQMGGGHWPKKVRLPNLNSFWVWFLLHRGLFYERPINKEGRCNTMIRHNTHIFLKYSLAHRFSLSANPCATYILTNQSKDW